MEDKNFIDRELNLLANEIKQKDFIVDVKKKAFANEVKEDIGKDITKTLKNIKKKKTFWSKLSIAIFG